MKNLDKMRQKKILSWLKIQAKKQKNELFLSVIIGFISAIFIIIQAFLLALILQELIINKDDTQNIKLFLILLFLSFLIRAVLNFIREKVNFFLGQKIRELIRKQILDKIEKIGPLSVNLNTTGGLSILLVEQIENLQDYYSKYLPQMRLASLVPILILIVVFPINWASALILALTSPLIPIFMIFVGTGAADINNKNFKALTYLGGHFLDRIKNLQTIKLFNQELNQTNQIKIAANNFRTKTMRVLQLAFLSSAVLEFFASISIALVAVYFGFYYLGEFQFGNYSQNLTLFTGFFILILAPEFFQPLRDLGTFYHAKAQAVAAADSIENFLSKKYHIEKNNQKTIIFNQKIDSIEAKNLTILSLEGGVLVSNLSFKWIFPSNIMIFGKSGVGKSSLIHLLLGFLPYKGHFLINGLEFNEINIESLRKEISWLGQSPYLLNDTIKNNILMGNPNANSMDIQNIIKNVQLSDFIEQLTNGIETNIGEDSSYISVGQTQRIALARALIKPSQIILLDEPTASLDHHTAQEINKILYSTKKNKITITHQIEDKKNYDSIWHLTENQFIEVTNKDLY